MPNSIPVSWLQIFISIDFLKNSNIYIYIYIYISSNRTGSTDFSNYFFLHPSLSSIAPAGFTNYILCPYGTNIDKFWLVSQYWNMKFFYEPLHPHTHSHIYIHIYIVIHRQICFVQSELISMARQDRFPKLGSKPGWLKRQSKIPTLSHEETSASEGNLNGYVSQLLLFTYIRLTATES